MRYSLCVCRNHLFSYEPPKLSPRDLVDHIDVMGICHLIPNDLNSNNTNKSSFWLSFVTKSALIKAPFFLGISEFPIMPESWHATHTTLPELPGDRSYDKRTDVRRMKVPGMIFMRSYPPLSRLTGQY